MFRGGLLALDLVNTTIVERGKPHDLLGRPADLGRWWEIVLGRYGLEGEVSTLEAATPEELAATHTLRAALRRVCTAVIEGSTMADEDRAILNAALAMAHHTLTKTPDGPMRHTYSLAAGGSPLPFQVALSALHLLTEHDLGRLHQCRNERCVLLFYDTTKSGTRQWCSLECFNRTRSSERYRQRKAAAQTAKA